MVQAEDAGIVDEQPGGAGNTPSPFTVAVFRLLSISGILLGVWVCWRAFSLTFYTPIGPGPGFFPFWLGLLLAIFSLIVLAEGIRDRASIGAERFLPPKGRLENITTIAAIAAFALLVEQLGFALTMFGVLLSLLVTRGCRLFPTAIGIALLGSFGVALAFTNLLGVFLPAAPAGMLRSIGL